MGGIVNKCELRPTLIVIDGHRVITIKKNEIFFVAFGAVWEGKHLSVLSGGRNR